MAWPVPRARAAAIDDRTGCAWRNDSVRSLGTPLSDATEERNWRKMLHRAINVRNRNPKAKTHKCRLNCGAEESMLHLTRCRNIRIYWNAVKDFLSTVLEVKDIQYIENLIIFNIVKRKLVSTDACAFIRHAFNHFYRDFAMVDTHKAKFIWEKTFAKTMEGLVAVAGGRADL